MDSLVFSLNATVPIFLMMVLGLFFNKIGWMDEEFANKMNKFVFRIPLPVLLFGDLAVVDIKDCLLYTSEMEQIKLTKEQLMKYPGLKTITVKIEEA